MAGGDGVVLVLLCVNAARLADGELRDLLWLEFLAVGVLGLGLGDQLDVYENWVASGGVGFPVVVALGWIAAKSVESSQTDVESEFILGCQETLCALVLVYESAL